MKTNTTVRDLAIRFGGRIPQEGLCSIGETHRWGWADCVLQTRLEDAGHEGNPYEFTAYDAIRYEWPDACTAVERGEPGADARLRDLLEQFEQALPDNDD